jgi:hypothetical protein
MDKNYSEYAFDGFFDVAPDEAEQLAKEADAFHARLRGTIATIYKRTITKAWQMTEQGDHYSLEPWGDDTRQYKGFDDGGKEYQLPDGYKVARDNYGDITIWTDAGAPCTIFADKRGLPALSTITGNGPVVIPLVAVQQ